MSSAIEQKSQSINFSGFCKIMIFLRSFVVIDRINFLINYSRYPLPLLVAFKAKVAQYLKSKNRQNCVLHIKKVVLES